MKLQPLDDAQYQQETALLPSLRGITGVPQWIVHGETNQWSVIITEHVGLPIAMEMSEGFVLSLKRTCKIGICLLEILKKVRTLTITICAG